jgi:hypothetical protein
MIRSLDFLLNVAGPLKCFKLSRGMRPLCSLKREVNSEDHVENGLELGGELRNYSTVSFPVLQKGGPVDRKVDKFNIHFGGKNQEFVRLHRTSS